MTKHSVVQWITTTLAGATLLAAGFYAGTAFAADARLDQAKDNIVKAEALLKAAANEGVNPPFGGHRQKAINNLKRALEHIDKAKAWADAPPKWAVKKAEKDKDSDANKKEPGDAPKPPPAQDD